jgi:hypothetical protein
VLIAIAVLVLPLLMFPVLKVAPFAVAVWVIPAALCQDTVCPTVTVSGLGEKELAPFSPTMVIVLSAPPPPGFMGLLSFPPQLSPLRARMARTVVMPRTWGSRLKRHLLDRDDRPLV